jgi:hypothetical protein
MSDEKIPPFDVENLLRLAVDFQAISSLSKVP